MLSPIHAHQNVDGIHARRRSPSMASRLCAQVGNPVAAGARALIATLFLTRLFVRATESTFSWTPPPDPLSSRG
ncbi:hypothetical protein [Promicromonospora sp. NPDC050880]|uniref:hypothetical protein n=1 Tax=Promicromonospora sp. NPDC050880 TaxID=3364406 RepID=UPI0037AE0671